MPVARRRRRLTITAALAAGAALLAPLTVAAQIPQVLVNASPGADVIALHKDGVAKAIAAAPQVISDIMARSKIPGAAVVIVHDGKTVFLAGAGLRKLGAPDKVTPDTVFQIASMSKPISATIAATVIASGKASWDDPVQRHLPWFTLRDPWVSQHVTIADMFAHRSGLPFAAGDDLEDLGFDRRQILERLRLWPLDHFRASYNYANFGITTGAEAIAAAAGASWEELTAQALFDPLGMSSTSASHAVYLARPNRAHLHALEDGAFRPLYDRDPDPQAPAGGVSSSARDIGEWLKLLLANGVHDGKRLYGEHDLTPAFAARIASRPPATPDDRGGYYGYGFNVGVQANGRTSFSHSGAFLMGAGTSFVIIPSAKLGVAVLTNGAPVGAAEAIVTSLTDIAQYGVVTRDWYAGYHQVMQPLFAPAGDLSGKSRPANPAPARPLAAYTGAWTNDYYGPVEISLKDGALKLRIGPAGRTAALDHWNGDTFTMTPPHGENEPRGSLTSVNFTMAQAVGGDASAPRANGFTINYLDRGGLGRWRRE